MTVAVKQLPIDIDELMEILPQRYPMLMLDRVLELTESHVVALKNISGNEPCLVGHFPKTKVFPGVMTTEAAAQASIVLIHHISEDNIQTGIPVLYHTNIKFKRVVIPGDQMLIHVNMRKKIKSSAIVDVSVYVDEEVVASGSLTFSIKDM